MKFQDSGLPKNKLVEEAFNHSYQSIMNLKEEALKDMQQQLHMGYLKQLAMLDADKQAGLCTPEEHKQEKERLDKFRDDQMKQGPAMIEEQLKHTFAKRRVEPAQQLIKNCENVTPETVATVMLLDTVRSTIDHRALTKKFGEEIGNMIAEIQHIDSYPAQRSANLEKASSDTKRVYMTFLANSLEGIIAQVQHVEKMSKANPGIPAPKLMMPPGQEEQVYNNAKAMWQNDAKLEKYFLDTFNRAAQLTASPFRLELADDGSLDLVKGNVTPKNNNPKNKPPGPKTGNSGLGDDVF